MPIIMVGGEVSPFTSSPRLGRSNAGEPMPFSDFLSELQTAWDDGRLVDDVGVGRKPTLCPPFPFVIFLRSYHHHHPSPLFLPYSFFRLSACVTGSSQQPTANSQANN